MRNEVYKYFECNTAIIKVSQNKVPAVIQNIRVYVSNIAFMKKYLTIGPKNIMLYQIGNHVEKSQLKEQDIKYFPYILFIFEKEIVDSDFITCLLQIVIYV